MDLLHYTAWSGTVVLVIVILHWRQRKLRRSGKQKSCILSAVIKAVAAIVLGYCCMATSNPIIWNLGYLPIIVHAVLLCDACADFVELLFSRMSRRQYSAKTAEILSVVLSALYIGYGTVNMQTIVPSEHVYVSDNVKTEHTFVFFSDLHYGSAQSEETVVRALREIAERKPEFIVLGGDITDEHTTAEEMKRLYQQLGSLSIPVYFIYGNHDRQNLGHYLGGATYSREELEETIRANGISILKDEIAVISDDLVLLGREDISEGVGRCSVSQLPSLPKEAYLVCNDHAPKRLGELRELGADLQVSGHSHAGQYFPNLYIYRIGSYRAYGDYRIGNTDLYVSPGIAGWYVPFRTQAHCSYEVITVTPKTPGGTNGLRAESSP